MNGQVEVSVIKYSRFSTAQLVNWESDLQLTVFKQLIDDGYGSSFKRLSLDYFDGNRTDGVCDRSERMASHAALAADIVVVYEMRFEMAVCRST